MLSANRLVVLLNSYLADIKRQAVEMFEWLIKQMSSAEGVIQSS